MKVPESCARCLYDKQAHRTQDDTYLRRVREILDARKDTDCSPYLVYQFNQVYREMFGAQSSYAAVKQKYNNLALGLESTLRRRMASAPDPLWTALQYARVGNYIDFGATNTVDDQVFLSLFDKLEAPPREQAVYASFLSRCQGANAFLLLCDNCGEIVLDKLFLEQLKRRFPQLSLTALVRGGEALNDATMEDAQYVGLDGIAKVVDNGLPITGTVYALLPPEAKDCFDHADVILSKGQGNYESLSGIGRRIFYSFLCKCDYFTDRFHVPRLTGMFIEE